MHQSDLDDILATANSHNSGEGITGILLYGDDTFIQVLEGPAEAVRSLYARIAKDPRHSECEVLLEEGISETAFAEWKMAYAALNDETARAVGGSVGVTNAQELIKFVRTPDSYVGEFIVAVFKEMMEPHPS